MPKMKYYDQSSSTWVSLDANNADRLGGQDPSYYTSKQYVDGIKQSLDAKDSVKVATTGNITLSSTQTIDGVVVSVGDRVLVKNQSSAGQNGIYTVASGTWTRSTDADTNSKLTTGSEVYVEQGTGNGQSKWVLTTTGTITLGTTALNFAQNAGIIGNGSNQIPKRDSVGRLVADQLTNYKVTKSNKDSNGIFTVVEYRRISDNTLFMKSTLSNKDTKGNYQTDTRVFYKSDGTTIDSTITVTITYDSDGDLLSEVPSA